MIYKIVCYCLICGTTVLLGLVLWRVFQIMRAVSDLSSEGSDEERLRRLAKGVVEGKYFLELKNMMGFTYLPANKAVKGDSWSPVITYEDFERIKELVNEIKREAEEKEGVKKQNEAVTELDKLVTALKAKRSE